MRPRLAVQYRLLPYTDAPRNSWSTGSRSYVWSHYPRILAVNWHIYGRNYNDALSGAKMGELERQMQVVNTQQVEYVTVLMGANDVRTRTLGSSGG